MNDVPESPSSQFRRRLRLATWDYRTPGLYFVTICTHLRAPRFGEIVDGLVDLSPDGFVVSESWAEIPRHHPSAGIDAMIVMPNHLHGIVMIETASPEAFEMNEDKTRRGTGKGALGTIIGSFKSSCARQINVLHRTPGAPVWQPNYYEHIIRSEAELERIRQYIEANPSQWAEDPENPSVTPTPVASRPALIGAKTPNPHPRSVQACLDRRQNDSRKGKAGLPATGALPRVPARQALRLRRHPLWGNAVVASSALNSTAAHA